MHQLFTLHNIIWYRNKLIFSMSFSTHRQQYVLYIHTKIQTSFFIGQHTLLNSQWSAPVTSFLLSVHNVGKVQNNVFNKFHFPILIEAFSARFPCMFV